MTAPDGTPPVDYVSEGEVAADLLARLERMQDRDAAREEVARAIWQGASLSGDWGHSWEDAQVKEHPGVAPVERWWRASTPPVSDLDGLTGLAARGDQ